jgi:hypothetical protein
MATKFFIAYIKSVASSNYEYDINTVSNIFVQELYACISLLIYISSAILARIPEKLSFG